jgi:hypothetical protein
MPSSSFRNYGSGGREDDWISVWARKGHVFLVVAGLRFDTGWHGHEEGAALDDEEPAGEGLCDPPAFGNVVGFSAGRRRQRSRGRRSH